MLSSWTCAPVMFLKLLLWKSLWRCGIKSPFCFLLIAFHVLVWCVVLYDTSSWLRKCDFHGSYMDITTPFVQVWFSSCEWEMSCSFLNGLEASVLNIVPQTACPKRWFSAADRVALVGKENEFQFLHRSGSRCWLVFFGERIVFSVATN